ncbi:hypothetical protein Tco_1195735 [Tanacetum coccineum]
MFSSMFRSNDLDDGDDRRWLYLFSGEVVYDVDEAVVVICSGDEELVFPARFLLRRRSSGGFRRERRGPIREDKARSLRQEGHVPRKPQVFSRIKHERDKPTRRRSLVSATVFTRLDPGDKNVFTRLVERKRDVHSRLGLEDAPRHKRVSRTSCTSTSAETPSQRRKDVRELIQSYVTCSSKRQQEIKEEWNTADRASRMSYTQTEELYALENNHDQGER